MEPGLEQAAATARPTTRVRARYAGGLRVALQVGLVAAVAVATTALAPARAQAGAGGLVVAWGSGPATWVPADLHDVVSVAAGSSAGLALRADGTVLTWGTGPVARPPRGLTDVRAIAARGDHALVLHQDGTLTAWGDNRFGQTAIPPRLGPVRAIAAGANHNLALLESGRVVAWGANHRGQSDVPKRLRTASLDDPVVAIAAGGAHSLALSHSGRLTSWGGPAFATEVAGGPLSGGAAHLTLGAVDDVPGRLGTSPLTDIAAAGTQTVARRADGTLVTAGNSNPAPLTALAILAMAVGDDFAVAVRRDGTVVAWGSNRTGQSSPPCGLTGVSAVAAGTTAALAVTTTAPPSLPFEPIDAGRGENPLVQTLQGCSPIR